ncbi:hypothetical protein NDU88_000412 [Pleurodeles waltl]|uniref:Uncharacterized protein n=1 Tax=Pleurodeles waltl TaxID=8319 RepID=A0AAV7S6Y7_PLEWA|nr:hypothetical protein NDU88_000412 [Pleurodeles waltl]
MGCPARPLWTMMGEDGPVLAQSSPGGARPAASHATGLTSALEKRESQGSLGDGVPPQAAESLPACHGINKHI